MMTRGTVELKSLIYSIMYILVGLMFFALILMILGLIKPTDILAASLAMLKLELFGKMTMGGLFGFCRGETDG